MGSEPLLNKRINEYLEIVGKYIKKGQIDLMTNGILLLKMDDSFFETCQRNHIRIAVTKYPVKVDYDRIEQLAISSSAINIPFLGL